MQEQARSRPGRWKRWLATVLAGAVLAAGGVAARGPLREWTRGHLRERHLQRIAALIEPQAAAAVRQAIELDVDAPSVLAPLLMDERPAVVEAAGEAIDRLLADWGRLPAEESSSRVEALAHELAIVAPKLAEDRRRWLHLLATRLVLWPLVGDVADRGQVVADCEALMRLPVPSEPELRVAATARPLVARDADHVEAPALLPDLPSTLPAAAAPAEEPVLPRVYGPVEPGRMIDASREQPSVPKQFLPPRAMKIKD